MFCPRCGRAVSETANFCGGCGLSRVEIEKYIQQTQRAAVTETPKTEEARTEVPFGTIVNEPVKTAPAEPVVETAAAEAAAEAVKADENEAAEAAEPMPEAVVDAVAEMVDEKAEAPKAEPAAEAPKAEPALNSYAQPQYTQQPVPAKNENLSTVDFIWMMFISGIPLVGFIYLIYLAVQNNNTNKRSYARATLLIMLFSVVIAVVFAFGIVAAGVI